MTSQELLAHYQKQNPNVTYRIEARVIPAYTNPYTKKTTPERTEENIVRVNVCPDCSKEHTTHDLGQYWVKCDCPKPEAEPSKHELDEQFWKRDA